MNDMGSRDGKFIQIIKDVRSELLKAANVSSEEFCTIIMQGSGTFGVESVISSVVNGTLLIIANGSYGKRMSLMAAAHNIPFKLMEWPEDSYPSLPEVERVLAEDREGKISHLAIVQSETTSGIINDVEAFGALASKYGRSTIVDAMSSFGAVPLDFKHLDYMITSANKCIEGIPGFSFTIARKAALNKATRKSSTLSLDIKGQVKGLDSDGQFRWTPPTHAILAFRQALREYDIEGGLKGRAARYKAILKIYLTD
jgi:2-aminoethylphosphonate-pyruvate transaminase